MDQEYCGGIGLSRPKLLSFDTYIINLVFSMFDLLMVVPVLSLIIREYHLSMNWAVWAVSLHLAFFAFSLPMMDNWAASKGKMEVLWTALTFFVLGTFLAGLAVEWVWFMCGRVIQAIGTGGMVPFVSSQCRRKLGKMPKGKRYLIMLAFAAAWCSVPLASAGLAGALGWKSVFILHILFAFLVLLISQTWKIVDQPNRKGVGGESIVFFGLIVLFLMMAVTSTDFSGGISAVLHKEVLPLWIVAIGMVVPLLMVERQGSYPFFEPHLFANWRLWILYIQVTLQGFLWTILTLLPFWFARQYDTGTYGSAVCLSFIVIGAMMALPVIGFLSNPVYVHRLAYTAFLLSAVTSAGMIWIPDSRWMLLAVCLLGWCLSFAVADPVHRYMFKWVSPRRIRSGLMAAGMFRAAGGALGFVTAARLFEPGVLISAEVRIFLFVAGVSFLGFLFSLFLGTKKVSHYNN
jgi:hypothetical protein